MLKSLLLFIVLIFVFFIAIIGFVVFKANVIKDKRIYTWRIASQ